MCVSVCKLVCQRIRHSSKQTVDPLKQKNKMKNCRHCDCGTSSVSTHKKTITILLKRFAMPHKWHFLILFRLLVLFFVIQCMCAFRLVVSRRLLRISRDVYVFILSFCPSHSSFAILFVFIHRCVVLCCFSFCHFYLLNFDMRCVTAQRQTICLMVYVQNGNKMSRETECCAWPSIWPS